MSFLMDLMYFGDFSILEQVSSGETFDRVNVIGKKGPAKGPPLVMLSTISTSVEPIPAQWRALGGDGLAAQRSDDGKRIHGLGANGGKVDAVLKILAGASIPAESFVRPLYVVALSGEEAHGSGVRATLDLLNAGQGAAVLHAPTGLALWTDHPGCIGLRLELTRRIRHRRMPPHAACFELRLTGRSGHALSDREGPLDDALARGLALLDTLRAHGEVRVLAFEAGETANRIPGRCVMQVATSYPVLPSLPPDVEVTPLAEDAALPFPINALFEAWFAARDAGLSALAGRLGEQRNAAHARPTRGSWTGRVRSDRDAIEGSIMLWTGPGVQTSDLVERFADAVQQALVGQEELEVHIEVVQDRPAFAGGEGHEALLDLAQLALRRAGLPAEIRGGTFTTDAGLFRAHGLDVVCIGPGGPLDRLYRDDESVDVARLEGASRFYEALIRAYCVDGR
jgi:acetylornithine deacetylase/succinyl-diaminopimelate desuccinylase-like protein